MVTNETTEAANTALRIRLQLAEGEHREIRQEQAARHAELRPGRYQAALAVVTRPFHRQQNGPTPFAADADALKHPQHRQDNRAPDADRFVGRNECNQEGGDAHAQQRCNQRRLAADAVSIVAEDRCADRAPYKADEIGSEGGERRRQRIRIGKEQLAENEPGCRAVKEEVVPLDRSTNR